MYAPLMPRASEPRRPTCQRHLTCCTRCGCCACCVDCGCFACTDPDCVCANRPDPLAQPSPEPVAAPAVRVTGATEGAVETPGQWLAFCAAMWAGALATAGLVGWLVWTEWRATS
jgi:hypothetical protein